MELLDLVQLGGLEKRFPAQLSGGQRQRVALARALAVDPRVLLLDEPFGALDARVRKDLRRWIRELHDETGQTTIFVTHDQDEALELADRVAILHQGRLEQIGTPDEVHEEPASAFVMSFVGESTRLPVRVDSGVVAYRGRTLARSPNAPDGDAGLYLRPWDAAFAYTPDALPGTVTLLRRSAGGRRAEIRLAESEDMIEIEIPPGVAIARGETVRIAIRGGRVFRT
jgi:sulfate transport system ATP-binding protein